MFRLLLLLFPLLAACGQTGDLYLPEDPPTAAGAAVEAEADIEEEDDREEEED